MTDQTGETVQVSRKAPRWMKIILVVSLMLNVLGIGAVGARAWMMHKHGPGFSGIGALGVHSFMRKLPKERRIQLRKKFRKTRNELSKHHGVLLRPLRNLGSAMVAENYDRSKVQGAVRSYRESHEQRAAAREKYILEFIDTLTPEERRMLGAKILQRAERRAKWHRRFQK